ncbi:MAG TPA: hypothetical protein VFC74_03015 [Oscillospiraceae bacterium]|nr:hypothetical protein [Oscillospiraceae bacterium]
MTKLKPDSHPRRLKKEQAWPKLSIGRRIFKKALVLLLFFAMFFSVVWVPLTDAFFTAEDSSVKTTFIVPKVDRSAKADAKMNFEAPMVIENMAEKSVSPKLTKEAAAAVDLQTGQEEAAEPIVWARLQLQGRFVAGDIFLPSLKLHYQGHTTKAQQGELIAANTLRVAFTRTELVAWFKALDQAAAQTLTITGEGYRGGLDHFSFTGTGILEFEEQVLPPEPVNEEEAPVETPQDEERAEAAPVVTAMQISGPVNIFIPVSPTSTSAAYTVEVKDQNNQLLKNEEVTWSLAEEAAGVVISANGDLAVNTTADAGTVTVVAVAQSNKEVSATLLVTLAQEAVTPPADTEEKTASAEQDTPQTEAPPAEEPKQADPPPPVEATHTEPEVVSEEKDDPASGETSVE